MSDYSGANLEQLISEMTDITARSQFTFGALTAPQLNWKPSAEAWSIGQCFDHLVAANRAYLPIFEQVVNGKRQGRRWENVPLLPKIFGKLLIKYLSPQSTPKLKAPEILKPGATSVDEDIIRRFIEQQQQVMLIMKRSERFDLARIRITSPAARFVVYSLVDAYEIIVVHEQRHFQQAERVLAAEGFPAMSEYPRISA